MTIHSEIIDACITAHQKLIDEGKGIPAGSRGRTMAGEDMPSPITLRDVRLIMATGSDSTLTPVVKAYGLVAAKKPHLLPTLKDIEKLKAQFIRSRVSIPKKKAIFTRAARKSKLSKSAFSRLVTFNEKDGSDYWFEDRTKVKAGQTETRRAAKIKITTAVLGSCLLVDIIASGGGDMGDVLEKLPVLKTEIQKKNHYAGIIKEVGIPLGLFARYTSAGNSDDGSAIRARASTRESNVKLRPEQLAGAHLLGVLASRNPERFMEEIELKIASLGKG